MRTSAAQALGQIGPEAKTAVPALAELLKDAESYVRSTAAGALGQIGPEAKGAVSGLIELLKDTESWVRSNALDTLGKIGPEAKPAVPALVKLLKESRGEHPRHRVRNPRDRSGCRRGPTVLNELVKEPSDWVRWKAEDAISKIKGQ